MEYIIFCICSVVIARYVEKKSRVVAIAHDILFILLSFAFFFASNNPTISSIVLGIVNKDIYNTIHNALVQSSHFIRGGFSVLFIIEGTICFVTAFASIIIFIRSLKELCKKIHIKIYSTRQNNNCVQKIFCCENCSHKWSQKNKNPNFCTRFHTIVLYILKKNIHTITKEQKYE